MDVSLCNCGKGTASQKPWGSQRETTSASPFVIFPRYDINSAIEIQDSRVNWASCNMLGELRSAGNVARHLRSSSSEILASSNRRVPVKVACWNVRTVLRTGKLENIKQEMKRLKINILRISETRWAADNNFWSDEFRVINPSSANGQGGVAIILDQTPTWDSVGSMWYRNRSKTRLLSLHCCLLFMMTLCKSAMNVR